MTIEIKPETKRLVQEELQNGHFRSVDEIIVQGVRARRATDPRQPSAKRQRPPGKKSLAQLSAESPFKGLDMDFERDADYGRDIAL